MRALESLHTTQACSDKADNKHYYIYIYGGHSSCFEELENPTRSGQGLKDSDSHGEDSLQAWKPNPRELFGLCFLLAATALKGYLIKQTVIYSTGISVL